VAKKLGRKMGKGTAKKKNTGKRDVRNRKGGFADYR